MRRDTTILILLLGLTLAVYWPVGGHDFILYDDTAYVTENPHVRAGLTPASVAWAFTSPDQPNWHPLTWLSHMLDVRLFGLNPAGHHATSLALHLASTLVLFLLLRRMTGARWRSALVAALFALHPLHVESVAWVAERKDVLSAFLGLLALLAWTGWIARPARLRYGLALLGFAAALMAKPMLVTLPFLLLLLDWWPFGRWSPGAGVAGPAPRRAAAVPEPAGAGPLPLKALVIEKWPFFGLAAAASLTTILFQQRAGAMAAAGHFPAWARVGNAFVSYVTYLIKTVWPSRLAVLYPHPGAALAPLRAAGAAALLLGLTAAVWRGSRERPWLAVGWLWFLGMLVPVVGFVPVGLQAWADRYSYLPLIGIFIIVAWGAADLARRSSMTRWVAGLAAGLALVGCAAATRIQLGWWRDSVTLFSRTLAVTRDNAVIENNLGLVLGRMGKTDEAMANLRAALRIWPDYEEAHNNLGNALADRGRWSEAIAEYAETLRLDPRRVQTLNNWGTVLLEQGRFAEAADRFRQALSRQPDHPAARCNLGLALESAGRLDEALAEYREVVRRTPGYAPAWTSLGIALTKQGRPAEAIEAFRRALELNPRDDGARRGLAAAEAGGGPAR